VAFFGEFAEKPRYQGGGSSHIHSFKITGAVEAAKAAGLQVTYAQGYSAAKDEMTEEQLAEAVKAAKAAKAAVVFAGLPDSYESEGYDRTHMRMPACQNRLIEAVAAANPNTVVVLHNGSPVEMPWIGRVKAVLEAYLGGQAVGEAAVRVLFGDVNPSGHLPESFPIQLEDNPSYLYFGGEGNVTEYREGVFVGYRYYDKKKMNVLFPFGYGLSYTTFEYSNLRLTKDTAALKDGKTIGVTVTVKNTGKRFGKTVVQLYTGAAGGDVIRPVRELKGFAKVGLEPGEAKDVSFTLDERAFACWNTQIHDWYIPAGQYTIEAGDSSRNLPLKTEITLEASRELPRPKFDKDSIYLDVMADPKGKAIMEEFMKKSLEIFGNPSENEESEVAQEAVTAEMAMAMMQYMPLRGSLSFGGGEESAAQMEQLIAALNS